MIKNSFFKETIFKLGLSYVPFLLITIFFPKAAILIFLIWALSGRWAKVFWSPRVESGFAVVFFICLIAFLGAASRQGSDNAGMRENQIMQMILDGRSYLDQSVPSALLEMQDPYDPVARRLNPRLTPKDHWQLLDASYYRGRLFLYWGPVPALVLFLPYHLLTGEYLSEQMAGTLFGCIAFVFLTLLFYALCEFAGFQRLKEEMGGEVILFLGSAIGLPFVVSRSDNCEVQVLAGVSFILLSWYSLIQFLKAENKRWLFVSGVAFGLAVGARVTMARGV